MTDVATSMIAQLLFHKQPTLNFARLVADLSDTLALPSRDTHGGDSRDRAEDDERFVWDGEDTASFDMRDSRVTLDYTDDLKGAFRACLSVAVAGPASRDATLDDDGELAACVRPDARTSRDTLCRVIAHRVGGRFPADRVMWHATDEMVTPSVIATYRDRIAAPGMDAASPQEADAARGDENAAQTVAPVSQQVPVAAEGKEDQMPNPNRSLAPALAPSGLHQKVEDDPADLDRILQRLEESLAERDASRDTARDAAASPAPRTQETRRKAAARFQPVDQIANDIPELPHPMMQEMQALRTALYEDAKPAGLSTPLRLACHAMNASLIVIALPIGGAMMTYSILRGENLNTSARMLAIVGMAVGVQHSPVGQQILSMI